MPENVPVVIQAFYSNAASDDQAGYRTCHGTKMESLAALNCVLLAAHLYQPDSALLALFVS